MPVPAAPRRVFLDLGETLVRPEPSWEAVYGTVLPRFRIRAESEDFRRAFSEAFEEWQDDGPFEASEAGSFQRLKELDGRVFAKLGYTDLPDEFFRAVEQAFHDRSVWFVYPDVGPSLDALIAAGIRLGVISNWGWAAPELLHLLELARHFDVITISGRVGYQKPHAAIFRHALDEARCSADEVIHVGDSYRADILGARRAGVAGVLIDRRGTAAVVDGRLADDPDVAVVRDLFELLDLLGIARPTEVAAS